MAPWATPAPCGRQWCGIYRDRRSLTIAVSMLVLKAARGVEQIQLFQQPMHGHDGKHGRGEDEAEPDLMLGDLPHQRIKAQKQCDSGYQPRNQSLHGGTLSAWA